MQSIKHGYLGVSLPLIAAILANEVISLGATGEQRRLHSIEEFGDLHQLTGARFDSFLLSGEVRHPVDARHPVEL